MFGCWGVDLAFHEGPLPLAFLATLVGSRLFTAVGKLAFVLSVRSLLVILGLPESAIF